MLSSSSLPWKRSDTNESSRNNRALRSLDGLQMSSGGFLTFMRRADNQIEIADVVMWFEAENFDCYLVLFVDSEREISFQLHTDKHGKTSVVRKYGAWAGNPKQMAEYGWKHI